MKIVFSDATLMHGGAERVISNLANYMANIGHEVEILLYYDKPIWYHIDKRVKITIDEKYVGKANIFRHAIWRRKYIRTINPDIVISFLAPFNMLNIIAMAGLKNKLIVADRNDPRYLPSNRIERFFRDILYHFADGVVLQSEFNKGYFSTLIQKKSTVILNPVDVGIHRGAALASTPQKVIISVGRLIPQKNPLMLLDAFSLISEEFPEYKLVYYGEGFMKAEICAEANKRGLAGRVELPGAITDIFNVMTNAELFVMSSEYEGMPNALLEAMCIGLPVISTKVSGATDVIQEGFNGLLVNCNDSAMLADAMRKLLGNPELRQAFAKSATRLADMLKTESIVGQWLEFIKITCSAN